MRRTHNAVFRWFNSNWIQLPLAGVEPACPNRHQFLKLTRIPISSQRLLGKYIPIFLHGCGRSELFRQIYLSVNTCLIYQIQMSKKSIKEREKKKYFLVHKYLNKRCIIKKLLKNNKNLDKSKDFLLRLKLQKLPRNSAPTRLHNRCSVSGRPKSFYRDFQLSRNVLREYALKGLLPGVIKSSW